MPCKRYNCQGTRARRRSGWEERRGSRPLGAFDPPPATRLLLPRLGPTGTQLPQPGQLSLCHSSNKYDSLDLTLFALLSTRTRHATRNSDARYNIELSSSTAHARHKSYSSAQLLSIRTSYHISLPRCKKALVFLASLFLHRNVRESTCKKSLTT